MSRPSEEELKPMRGIINGLIIALILFWVPLWILIVWLVNR